MLTNDQVQAAVEYGHETTNVEFKRACAFDEKSSVPLIARAAMALANSRDGGHILLGVDDKDPTGPDSGIEDQLAKAWLDHDNMTAKINTFADPALTLHAELRQLRDGRNVVVIEVSEFDSVPILCSKDHRDKLESGEMYTRSLASPASTKRRSQNELRAVLELATQKQLRRFIDTARGALIDIGLPNDRDQFAAQDERTQLSPSATPQVILRMRPSTFERDRIPYQELDAVPAQIQVSGNGWSMPDSVTSNDRGDDWIEARNEWRLFQSGLFVLVQAFPEGQEADTGGVESETTPAAGYVPAYWLTVQLSLAMELATRYQQHFFRGASIEASLAITGAAGWQLVTATPSLGYFFGSYRLGADGWSRQEILTSETALQGGRPLARKLLVDLFQRFGWRGVNEEIVANLQNRTLGIDR